ncbi:uncharacterized protein LOC114531102 [Dendronephthya gigantea]|uniref:uncharacterized protein LOC114531102 n=1 Tax=Dendronephthya gigantea TaxID=151771 RepID=UPI00106D9F80|nr:uncharacterized protein LOC114531102 [Dendronephthya gigantea]
MVQYSKPYPLTKGLFHYTPKSSKSHEPLPLGSTSLADYKEQKVDQYLKDVVRSLKEPLALFPKIILRFELFVTVRGIEERLFWELTIKEARASLDNVLDAFVVLHQDLFHSKCLLKYVEQFLDEDQKNDEDSKRFSEKEVQKLTKLKENLLELNKFLDCVLLHYSSLSCNKPAIEDIKRAAKKIYKAINNLKPDRLANLVPDSVIREEDVLCSVVGLKDDFASRLKGLSKEMRRHQTDEYFLLCFMEELDESMNVDDLRDKELVENSLQKMGFTENRSSVIAKWISEQPFPGHKSLLAWAKIYIENMFKYDIFLNDKVPKFPYSESKLGEWFSVPVEREEDESGGPVPKVSVINTKTKNEAKTSIEQKISEFQADNPKAQLYFHGTDHKGAKDILEDGIKLGLGKPCCDFSNGWGFYVADHFQYALDWTDKHRASAVIVFNISQECLNDFQGLDLRGTERRDDLKSVVDFFKSGEKQKAKISKKLKNEVKNRDFIIGPISRDGGTTYPEVQQICIRKDGMAEEIQHSLNIVGVVFFLNAKETQLARKK